MEFKAEFDWEEWSCYNYGEYDFIVVKEKRYKDWELATNTACILIFNSCEFKEWFMKKSNRERYFSSFIYGLKS